MTQGFEGGTTGFADDPDEDTIELELAPEQVLALSQAAKGAQTPARPVESTPGSSSPASPSPKPRLQAGGATRFRLWPLGLAAAVVGIAAAIAWWWAAAQRAAEWNPPAVTSPLPAAVVPPPAAPAEPQGPPVRVRNPFDAREVFEFPAGTSETEAREAVAELLLQRARDRRSQGAGSNHAGGRRSARGAADENPGAPNPEMRTPR
ncbi:MAG TPA: hypothetical protein VGD47_12020 [Steroidobacteraceae bacterium]